MSKTDVVCRVPERWITEISGGQVRMVQRVPGDAFVVSLDDLPDIAANEDFVSDDLAVKMHAVLSDRLKVR